MSLYTQLSSLATRLLKDKGSLLTMTRFVETSRDSVAGSRTGTEETTQVYAVMLPVSNSADRKKLGDTDTITQEYKMYVDANTGSFSPLVGYTVAFDSEDYYLKSVTKVNPSGEVVYFECLVSL